MGYAFKGYYGGSPKIAKLILREMYGNEAIKLAESYQVHDLANYAFNFNGDEPVFQKGQHFRTPVAATWIVGINTRLAPFNKVETRKAFVAAIDSDDFRKRFYPNALPANGYIPPGLPGFQWAYEEPGKSSLGLPSGSIGVKEKIKVYIPIELSKGQEIAEYLMKSWDKAGFRVEVVLTKWENLMKGYNGKSLQAFLVSMNIDYPDTEFLVRNFESANPDNFSGLKDSKVDDLIRKARATPDKAIRHKYYVELVKLLKEAAVTVNLFHPQDHYWVHPCVQGFHPDLLADTYINYKNVSVDELCLANLPGRKVGVQ
ncbi:MAG: hypothetical protein HY547_05630 [Elusimicrobia bacterium]|nr:hypothetical protein [Elusimicrobiota bacterium]